MHGSAFCKKHMPREEKREREIFRQGLVDAMNSLYAGRGPEASPLWLDGWFYDGLTPRVAHRVKSHPKTGRPAALCGWTVKMWWQYDDEKNDRADCANCIDCLVAEAKQAEAQRSRASRSQR